MNLANNPQLSALIASFEIYHTSRLPKTVDWDLSVVLNALAKPPFEPIASAHIKLLAWKTAILVMLASARRSGEVHAFRYDRVTGGPGDKYVSLGVSPEFVTKSKLSTVALRAVRIPSLGTS